MSLIRSVRLATVPAKPSRKVLVCRLPKSTLLAAALLTAVVSLSAEATGADILAGGLALTERSYLFYKELDADRLLGEALEYVEDYVPQLTAERVDGRAFVVSAGSCRLRVENPPGATVAALQEPLAQVARMVEACGGELREELPPVESLLLAGVLSGLDPYSTVLDERRRTEHSIQFRGQLAGIGARIGVRDDKLTLVTVYPDSPAARAGLADGDAVLRIDDLSATNILVSDAVERIRGDEGTTVVLRIERGGEEMTVAVTRALVTIPSVTAKMLPDGILHAVISQFSQTTPDDFRQQVGKLVAANEVKGVVIDLRANSGGSMLGSSAIGDMFLSEGVLITTAGRDGKPARGLAPEVRATADTPFAELPVVFLTSPRTASGSELLAASLRNNDRALIVGERSYGKGTVQKTYNIGPTTTLKMTVGHFLPNGQPIPGGGLVPDVEILRYRFGQQSVVIPFAKDTRDVPFWLRLPEWAHGVQLEPRHRLEYAETFVEADEKKAAEEGEELQPEHDWSLELAAGLVGKHGNTSARVMLESADAYLRERIAEAENALVTFMVGRQVDWASGAREADAKPSLRLSVAGTKPLTGGEEAPLVVTLTNDSDTPLYRLRSRLTSSSSALAGQAAVFGHIDAHESRSWTVRVTPPLGSRTGRVEVSALVFDDQGEVAEVGPVFLPLEGNGRPHLAYRYRVETSGDPALRTIVLDVENRGDTATEELHARLSHPLNGEFEIIEGNAIAKDLAPGTSAELRLTARLAGTTETPPTAELVLSDTAFGLFLDPSVQLVATPEPSAWYAPPRITVAGFTATEGNPAYELQVLAEDDSGIASVHARVDGDTIAHVAPTGSSAERVRLALPWSPDDGVVSYTIEATDSDGLTDSYSTGL